MPLTLSDAQDYRSGTTAFFPGTGLTATARPAHGLCRASTSPNVSQPATGRHCKVAATSQGTSQSIPHILWSEIGFLRLFTANILGPLKLYHMARPMEAPVYNQLAHPPISPTVLPAASYHKMNKAKKTFSYTSPHDRPATPPESSPNVTRDEHHLHLLKANHAAESDENATCRRFPANPPSTPNLPPEERLPGHSPTRMSVSPTPPSTPPTPALAGQLRTAFIFSKNFMTSKKLSSSVHGKTSSCEARKCSCHAESK